MKTIFTVALLLAVGCTPAEEDARLRVEGEIVATRTAGLPESGEVMLGSVDLRAADRVINRITQSTFAGLDAEDGAPYALAISNHLDDEMYYRPGGAWGDLEIASFLVGAWAEVDGAPGIGLDDYLVGASPTVLVRVRYNPAMTSAAVPPGWYWFDYDPDAFWEGPANLDPIDDFVTTLNVATNLLPAPRAHLDVRTSWAAVADHRSKVAILSLAETPDPELVAEAISPRFGADLDTALPFPAADHITMTLEAPSGVKIADICQYHVLAYVDRNDNGRWDMLADALIGDSMLVENPLRVQHAWPTNMAAVLTTERLGVPVGWNLVEGMANADGVYPSVPWNHGVDLTDAPRLK